MATAPQKGARTRVQKAAAGADGETLLSTRGRIVRATRDCIARFGAAKTSLEDVATTARVHRQTIYRQFANREELFKAVMQDCLGHLASRVREKIDAQASLKAAIIVGTMETLRMAREDACLMAILHEMHSVSVDNQLISSGADISDQFAAIWRPLFQRAKRDGEIARQRSFEDFSQWMRGAQYVVLLREDLSLAEQERLLRVFIEPGLV